MYIQAGVGLMLKIENLKAGQLIKFSIPDEQLGGAMRKESLWILLGEYEDKRVSVKTIPTSRTFKLYHLWDSEKHPCPEPVDYSFHAGNIRCFTLEIV